MTTELRAALAWALELAEAALEQKRTARLSTPYNEIGVGTGHLGLTAEEVEQMELARKALGR